MKLHGRNDGGSAANMTNKAHEDERLYPDVMSIEQMCEILSISTKTGYRILREGKICCLKVGRAYRIPKAHLFTYLCIGCGEAVTA